MIKHKPLIGINSNLAL